MEYQQNNSYTNDQYKLIIKVFIGDDASPTESPLSSYDENALIQQAIYDSQDDEDILRYLLTLENIPEKKIADIIDSCHFDVKEVIREYKNKELDATEASKKVVKVKSLAQIIDEETF